MVVLPACRPRQTAADRVEIEFWTLQLLNFEDLLVPMFERYEKEHPGVDIKWVDVPFSEGEKRTLTAMMSPNVPDVVNLNPDFSAVLASRNALVDMSEAVTAERQDRYLDVAWQAATISKDGEPFTFGLPWYITSSITIYNRRLLMQSGYPSPPDRYGDIPAFARTVRQKTDAFALMPVIAEHGNFLKELKKLGITLYENNRAVFADDPQAVAHLARYAELYKNNLIPADAITEGHRQAVDKYQSGQLALLLTGPNFLNIVKENAPKVYEDTGVAPQFPPDAAYKDFSMMLLVVPKKSAHPKEAVDFALYMTNAVNQLALAKRAPVLPSVKEALDEPYFRQIASAELADRARAISAEQLMKATEAYQIRPGQQDINAVIDLYVQQALLGGLTPREALTRAQQEINDILTSL